MKKQWISILIVGLTMGTAWAIRGQFGHEQGAAWAGGIGALALVLVSKRKDWYNKILTVALSSAFGWGAGGMISYGIVVGYGRSNNLPNAFYGLLMLFVIGGLFGLLGGGLTGLTLDSAKEKKVNWGSLIAEMTAGGLICYGFLIDQIGLLMTPPRSEAWAICLGAGLAMVWHMARNNHNSALRVAVISAIGAGIGFSFGNFLQTAGTILEINFNMWNVMEYSIGFFGGTALAYGIFSSEWPENSDAPKLWENRVAFLFLFLLIPLIVFRETMQQGDVRERFGDIPGADNIAFISSLAGAIVMAGSLIIGWLTLGRVKFLPERKQVLTLFILYLVAYILISYVVTGLFAGKFHLNHHLYVANFIVILLFLKKQLPAFMDSRKNEIKSKDIILAFSLMVIIILLLSFIAINLHGEMSGAHDRFPV